MRCPFCEIDKERTRIVGETERTLVLISNPSLMKFHLLVVPKRHVEKISELNTDEKREIFEQLEKFQEKLLKKFGGCDIRQHYHPFRPQNELKVNHLHFHLQPRDLFDELYEKCQIHEKNIFRMLNQKELEEIKDFFEESPKKTKIGIDLDEVVVEYIKYFLRFYNEKKKTNFFLQDIKFFDLEKSLDISREELAQIAEELNETDIIEKQNFIEGAIPSINFLEKNFEIFFITDRPLSVKERTLNFLKENFPHLNFKVFFSRDHQGGRVFKATICEENNIPFIIEDRDKNALKCVEKGITVLLFDKPWNQNVEHKNIIRVKSWKEVLEKIKDLNGKKEKNIPAEIKNFVEEGYKDAD